MTDLSTGWVGGYVTPGYVQTGYVVSGRPPFVDETIQSQYSASPRIKALIHAMSQQLDATPDIDLFFRKVFDISSAEGWGLDNWGRILGLGRDVEISSTNAFGFQGSGLQPFNQAAFDNGGLTRVHTLDDATYFRFLMLKAAANIADSTIPTINRFMKQLFADRGDVYVLEVGVMQIQYTFKFILTPFERLLMRLDWMIPRPGCVSFTWVEEPV